MSVEPFFFNLYNDRDGVRRELGPGLTTRVFSGAQSMLSLVSARPGAQGPAHKHPQEQWGVLLHGTATRIQNGKSIAVNAGDFWRTPGGVEHGVIVGAEGALILDIFSPPRLDFIQQD
ncbi:MAG: cupin domain-containing protein [Hyphococcus sp.]